MLEGKLQPKLKRVTVPMKTKKINHLTPVKPKEGIHTHRERERDNNKITGINNHWSIISLKIINSIPY